MGQSIKSFFKQPLVQLVALGGLVFGVSSWLDAGSGAQADRVVVITVAEVEAQRATWEARWGRPPTEQELQGTLDQLVREQVLAQEAIRMGLDKDDVVIRRRLVQKVEFLTDGLATLQQPSEQDLRSYYAERKDEYQFPAQVTFAHVFFSPDSRGATRAEADARAALDAIRAGGVSLEGALEMGDRIMLEPAYQAHSPAQVRRVFGQEFTDALFAIGETGWHGPIASGYGVHLVFLQDWVAAEEPAWELVAPRVEADWRLQRQTEARDLMYSTVLEQYTVVVEDPEQPAGQR
jgi:parvulin-like peptidyl-prolyl isomerase